MPCLCVRRLHDGLAEALHLLELRTELEEQEIDAGALEFPDAAFDVALAPYVMSVVPSPDRALDEAWRVLRPGGTLIVMNHFAASGGLRARIERRMETAAAFLVERACFKRYSEADGHYAVGGLSLQGRLRLDQLSNG